MSDTERFTRDPSNANVGTARGRAIIAASIAARGAGRSGLAASDGTMIAGSQTLAEMQAAGVPIRAVHTTGDEWVVVIRDDIAPGSADATLLALEDNRASEVGLSWSPEALLAIQAQGVALEALWTDDELTALLGEAEVIPGDGGDEFDAEPEDGDTRCQSGDLWVLGGVHRLICGDCTDPAVVARLMAGERAALVFEDPPYNVAYQDNESIESLKARNRRTDGKTVENDSMTDEEFDHFLDAHFSTWPIAPGGAYYLCAPPGHPETQFRNALNRVSGCRLRECIVWVKDRFVFGRQDYHWRHESILYGWKEGAAHYFADDRTQDTVWEIARPTASPDHPTQKPIALSDRVIRNSSRSGDIVFDGFAGSGTMLVSAHRLGRVARACEIAPKYCDVILRRAEAEGLAVQRAEP